MTQPEGDNHCEREKVNQNPKTGMWKPAQETVECLGRFDLWLHVDYTQSGEAAGPDDTPVQVWRSFLEWEDAWGHLWPGSWFSLFVLWILLRISSFSQWTAVHGEVSDS